MLNTRLLNKQMNHLREAALTWNLCFSGGIRLLLIYQAPDCAFHPLKVDTLTLFLPGNFPSAMDWTISLRKMRTIL